MFGLDSHWGFVIVSYALSTLVLGGLIISVVLDQRRQKRTLAELEAAGIGRRGRRGSSEKA